MVVGANEIKGLGKVPYCHWYEPMARSRAKIRDLPAEHRLANFIGRHWIYWH